MTADRTRPGEPMAAPPGEVTEPEAVVRAALAAHPLIGSPAAATSEYYAEGFVFHANPIQTASLDAFSDIEVTVEEVVSRGDRVTVRYTAHGRHTGEFRGLPATERWMDVRGIAVLRVAEGRIAEGWGSLNWA